jgi:hypothetical protein
MDAIDRVLYQLPEEIVTRDQDIATAYTTDFRRLYKGSARA